MKKIDPRRVRRVPFRLPFWCSPNFSTKQISSILYRINALTAELASTRYENAAERTTPCSPCILSVTGAKYMPYLRAISFRLLGQKSVSRSSQQGKTAYENDKRQVRIATQEIGSTSFVSCHVICGCRAVFYHSTKIMHVLKSIARIWRSPTEASESSESDAEHLLIFALL